MLPAKPPLRISNQVSFSVWTSLITEYFVIYPLFILKVLIYLAFCCHSLIWQVFLLGRHLFFSIGWKVVLGGGSSEISQFISDLISQFISSEDCSKLAIGQKFDIKTCTVLEYILPKPLGSPSISSHCPSLLLFTKRKAKLWWSSSCSLSLSLCSGYTYTVSLSFWGFEMIFRPGLKT